MSAIGRRLTIVSAEASCQLLGKRFAGGGGRPGGKPTLNWREKMQLRLSNKSEKRGPSVQPYGDFNYLEKQLDPSRGDFLVTLKGPNATTMAPQEITKMFQSDSNTKKVINISALFGSDKPAGMLPHKHNKKKNFSHKRIFGGKN